MTSFEMIPYYVHCSMYFAISLMLLFVKSYSEMGSKTFQRIKQMLALCGLLECFKAAAVLLCEYYKFSDYIFGIFIFPMAYYVQLASITLGLLALVHSQKITRSAIWMVLSPILVLVPSYLLAYLVKVGFHFSLDIYTQFSESTVSAVFYYIWRAIIYIEIVFSIYFLFTETRLYRHQLVTVFSGRDVVNGRKLTYLVYGFIFYFALMMVESYFPGLVLRQVLMMFNTLIFLAGAIVLFNIQDMYSRAMLVENYTEKSNGGKESDGNLDQTEYEKINNLITEWESKGDKPYLRNGFTLLELAEEINVKPYELNDFLKNICKMDFNSWVGLHRIDYAMKLITESPEMSLSEVAKESGFRNLKAMTKSFVNITGKAPEEYVNAN